MNPEASQPTLEGTEAEESQLCLCCLAPNPAQGHFCVRCGAPLSAYAATAPFESAYAEGFVIRKAVETPAKGVVFAGTLAFASMFAVLGLVALTDSKPGFSPEFLTGLAALGFAAALGGRALVNRRRH